MGKCDFAMVIEDFSEEYFTHCLLRNLRSLQMYKHADLYPKAVLLGGQSGAGKTTIHVIKQKEFNGNIIILDADSYRTQHPYYCELLDKYGKESVKYTSAFSAKMVRSLIDELSSKKYNLIIEGTLRSVEVPSSTAKMLIDRGYRISLAVIATKPELSWISTLIRYREMYLEDPKSARATPKDHHDNIVNNIVDNLLKLEQSKIFDRIQIYKRDEKCIYDSDSYKNSPNITAASVLKEVLFGKKTIDEKKLICHAKNRLNELDKLIDKSL